LFDEEAEETKETEEPEDLLSKDSGSGDIVALCFF
jgi:hypothetical protein|tara:strand:- start:1800 stop:1904 length:105 start_codon:yes stop_codon:yes gene_type:complete